MVEISQNFVTFSEYMNFKYGAYLTNYQNAFDMRYAVVSGILLELTFSSLNMLLLIFHFNWHYFRNAINAIALFISCLHGILLELAMFPSEN